MNITDIRRAMENILYKASVDEYFRQMCLEDGKKVLEEELDFQLANDISVRFKENDGTLEKIKVNGKDLLFILPDFVGALIKLEMEHLERITGGVQYLLEVNNLSIEKLASFI